MKQEMRCEAKYGDRQCEKIAVTSIISQGIIFKLCKNCGRIAKRQIESYKNV